VGDAVDMLGLAVICWAIWKARNKTCFDKIKLKSPNEFFYSACVFMRYWSGLYPEGIKQKIVNDVEVMLKTAFKILEREPQPEEAGRLKNGSQAVIATQVHGS
jgi:hypothetical protein